MKKYIFFILTVLSVFSKCESADHSDKVNPEIKVLVENIEVKSGDYINYGDVIIGSTINLNYTIMNSTNSILNFTFKAGNGSVSGTADIDSSQLVSHKVKVKSLENNVFNITIYSNDKNNSEIHFSVIINGIKSNNIPDTKTESDHQITSVYSNKSNFTNILYCDEEYNGNTTTSLLKFTQNTNSANTNWITPVIIDSSAYACSLISSDSNLYISYFTDTNLKYAFSSDNGQTWIIKTITHISNKPFFDELFIRTSISKYGNKIYICYYDPNINKKTLKLAISPDDGENWEIKNVDMNTNPFLSMQLHNDALYLVYSVENADTYSLKLAKTDDDGDSWSYTTLDSHFYDVPILEFLINNNEMYLCYCDAASDILRIAISPDLGKTWSWSFVDESSVRFSMGLYKDFIYIGYTDCNSDFKIAKISKNADIQKIRYVDGDIGYSGFSRLISDDKNLYMYYSFRSFDNYSEIRQYSYHE